MLGQVALHLLIGDGGGVVSVVDDEQPRAQIGVVIGVEGAGLEFAVIVETAELAFGRRRLSARLGRIDRGPNARGGSEGQEHGGN